MSKSSRISGSDSPKDGPEEHEPNPLEDVVLGHVGEPVGELVNHVAAEGGVKLEAATRGLCMAVEESKVRLVDLNPPKGLPGYPVSLYSLWFWLIAGFVGIVLASIYVMPQVYPFDYMRYLLGAVFVLFIPGFVLVEVLYPKADEDKWLGRLLSSVVLSILMVGVVGLVLFFTRGVILLDSIVTALALPVLGLGVVGVWRKYEYFVLVRRDLELIHDR